MKKRVSLLILALVFAFYPAAASAAGNQADNKDQKLHQQEKAQVEQEKADVAVVNAQQGKGEEAKVTTEDQQTKAEKDKENSANQEKAVTQDNKNSAKVTNNGSDKKDGNKDSSQTKQKTTNKNNVKPTKDESKEKDNEKVDSSNKSNDGKKSEANESKVQPMADEVKLSGELNGSEVHYNAASAKYISNVNVNIENHGKAVENAKLVLNLPKGLIADPSEGVNPYYGEYTVVDLGTLKSGSTNKSFELGLFGIPEDSTKVTAYLAATKKDGSYGELEKIGDVNGSIDYSMMKGKDTEMSGSVTGKATGSKSEGYTLNVTVKATNNSPYDVTSGDNVYMTFDLPFNLSVASFPDGTMPDISSGNTGIAVHLTDVKANGGTFEKSFSIPLNGYLGTNGVSHLGKVLHLVIKSPDEGRHSHNLTYVNGKQDIDYSEVPTNTEITPGKPGKPDKPGKPGNPANQLKASVDGKVGKFNSKNHYYPLNLNVKLTNNSDETLKNQYVGFELPKGVTLAKDVKGVAGLNLDNGKKGIAVKFSEIKKGDNSKHYTIPLIGKTDGKVSDTGLKLYKITQGGYEEPVKIDGKANIDYSTMNQAWYFNSHANLVTCADVPKGMLGLSFDFTTQNLTAEEVNAVRTVQFTVPKEVTVHAPDYYKNGDIPDYLKDWFDGKDSSSSNLDIKWKGNTATVKIPADKFQAGSGYEGFFEAFGKSNKTAKQLEGLKVKVTFKGDGVNKTVEVPFTIVDEKCGTSGGGNGGHKDNGDGNGGHHDGNTGGGHHNGGGTINTGDNHHNNGNGATNQSGHHNGSDNSQGGKLPVTATETPMGALVGVVIAGIGAALFAFRKKLFKVFS